LQKRSKKLLIILASACPDRLAQVSQKFFWFFFSKKKSCLHRFATDACRRINAKQLGAKLPKLGYQVEIRPIREAA
jgi:hypothetical protein